MLRELRIRNFAVIESVAVEFRPGLNVLTGETGAGKSMLIDAILLVLGGRAQTDVIRSDADAATLEAVFDVEPRGAVVAALDEAGLALDDGLLVARRELGRSGRHRAFVHDAPVRRSRLRDGTAPPRSAGPRRPSASRPRVRRAHRASRRGPGAARGGASGGPGAPRLGDARAGPTRGDRRAARRPYAPQAEVRRHRGGDAQVPRRGRRRARPPRAPRGNPRRGGAEAGRAPCRAGPGGHGALRAEAGCGGAPGSGRGARAAGARNGALRIPDRGGAGGARGRVAPGARAGRVPPVDQSRGGGAVARARGVRGRALADDARAQDRPREGRPSADDGLRRGGRRNRRTRRLGRRAEARDRGGGPPGALRDPPRADRRG